MLIGCSLDIDIFLLTIYLTYVFQIFYIYLSYFGENMPCVTVREHFSGVCGPLGGNIGHPFWWHALFPTEPPHQFMYLIHMFKCTCVYSQQKIQFTVEIYHVVCVCSISDRTLMLFLTRSYVLEGVPQTPFDA